nr:glycoside hydrolase family 3 N-terminal domain-containing protein [Roseofilum capinflatum]
MNEILQAHKRKIVAIASGVDGIMSAHLQIPAWNERYPATLSATILTQKLRQDLGFSGLMVTDALVMGAITNHYGSNLTICPKILQGRSP